MRKLLALGALAGFAAIVLAQVRGIDLLKAYAQALNGAKSVSATYTVQRVGDSAQAYSVDLAKPNKARIDTPAKLIVADGTTITTFDKKDNSYVKQQQTDADFKALFTGDELNLFRPFFDAAAFDKMTAAKANGQKVRKGVNYNVVVVPMDDKGKRSVTYYLDPADKLAKHGEFNLTDAGTTDTTIVMTKDFAVDQNQNANLFAFNPPDGAKEISLEELNAGKWYEDLDEAMAMAKRLNRPLFVDFYADW